MCVFPFIAEDTEYQLSLPFAVYLQTFAILCTMRALKHDRDCVVFRLLLQALLLRVPPTVHLFTLVSPPPTSRPPPPPPVLAA
jgi:hypothetical protein